VGKGLRVNCDLDGRSSRGVVMARQDRNLGATLSWIKIPILGFHKDPTRSESRRHMILEYES